jgi:uncharacterized metal-binding protein
MSECCGENGGRKVLLYACSGAANVGEVADRACRELQAAGEAGMSCLAGLGGGIEDLIERAREADLNVVVDGCDIDCGRAVFERVGLSNFIQVRVTDLGVEKSKSVRATAEQVADAVSRIREAIELSVPADPQRKDA